MEVLSLRPRVRASGVWLWFLWGVLFDRTSVGEGQSVSVDGQEFTLTGSPSLDCDIGPEAITFAFWVGDNSTTLGGGANLYDDGWLGSIRLSTVDDEGLPVAYYPDDGAMDGGVAISGDSMSFSGPMLMQPPNDGTNPPPVQVGDGTISVTCG